MHSSLGSSQDEIRILCEANPVIPADCFGFPDSTDNSGQLVFDESSVFDVFFRDHLAILFQLSTIFGTGPLVHFGLAEVARVRHIWAYIDDLHGQLEGRLAGLAKVPEEAVVVQHEWHGNWRPAKPKAHATVLLGEAISGTPPCGMDPNSR